MLRSSKTGIRSAKHPARSAQPALRSRRGHPGTRAWLSRHGAALAVALLAGCFGSLPAHALDLATVLRQVAAANPTLAARRAMVEAKRRAIAPAGAWDSPMVEFGAMNVPTSGRFDEEPMTMKTVGVSQTVPIFGRNSLARRAASQAFESEAAESEMAHYEFFAMAWGAYADVYYAAALAAETQTHLATMDRLVAAARARYQSGNGRLDDVLRAEAERARVYADLADFEAEESSARARLAALRGREPGGESETLEPPPSLEVTQGEATWQAAVNESHPRLRAQDASVARARFAARSMRRSVWPDLKFSASYGARETLRSGSEQDGMFSVMVGFMLPVFASQNMLAEAAEMDAMAEAATAERRVAELRLREQVASLVATVRAADRNVALLADTVVVTQQRALDASWSGYSAGSTDLWRVLEAAHTLYLEHIALVRARGRLERTRSQLLAVTARGDLFGMELPEIERSQP